MYFTKLPQLDLVNVVLLMISLGATGLGEENHRDRVPFSLCAIGVTYYRHVSYHY